MPDDAEDYMGKKAEVWISFKKAGDTAMVQVELASRLFISTAPPPEPAVEEPAPEVTEEPAEEPTVTPQDNENIDISVDAQQPDTTTEPVPEVVTNEPAAEESGYSWLPLGVTLGALAVVGTTYLIVKRRQSTR